MKQLKINVPEGHEIDLDNSDLLNGVVQFKQVEKQLPKSWKELKSLSGYYVGSNSEVLDADIDLPSDSDRNVFPTREQTAASIALAQLLQLREVYRDGWEPNWEWGAKNWTIAVIGDEWTKPIYVYSTTTFAFQSEEIRDMFFENFSDLLEKVKPLFI